MVASNNRSPENGVVILDQFGNQIADSVGHSLVVTEIDHYLIHKGVSFIYSDTLNCPTGAPTNIIDFVVSNTTDVEVHLQSFEFTSTQGDAEIILYHQITSDEDGDLVTVHNKNFNSTNLSTASIRVDPSNVVLGAAEHQVQHFLIVGGKQIGGTADSGIEEYVIKQNEKLLLRYTNNSNQIDKISFKIGLLDVGAL